jgi:hypothetical protein
LSILAGVLCRHVLRIFFMVRVRYLSEEYIMKRWAMDSAGSIVVNQPLEPGISPPECLAVWYNDLCQTGTRLRFRRYLLKLSAKNQQMSEMKICSEQQDMLQLRMPLPKLQAKKAPSKK